MPAAATELAATRDVHPVEAEPIWRRLLPFVLVFGAACFMFFARLGDYPLFNPDESLYAEPAREMLDTGEYVTTLLNYVVRFTKPPLVIWAMALCYKVFGVNEFAARFVGAACGALLVAATYWFVERYASRRAAIIAGCMLNTAPLFIGTAREAITDMPLSLFIAGALMSFYHGFAQRKGAWRWPGYVLVGLAVMTKGPVGLILPVGILAAYYLLQGELKAAWRYYKPRWGLLVVALISVPWFAVEIYVTHGAYYQEFLVRENFQRFTSVVDHKGAWWYHIAAVAGGFMPWTIYVPQALWEACRSMLGAAEKRLRSTMAVVRSRAGVGGAIGDVPSRAELPAFCGLWFVAIVAFFSVSVSKLLPYTLPAFPALAVLVALYIDGCLQKQRRVALAAPLFLLGAALAVASYVVPLFIVRLRELPPQLPVLVQSTLFALLALAIVCGVAMLVRRQQVALAVFAAGVFCCFAGYGQRALDITSNEWEGPVPAFSQFASLSHEPIIVWHMRKPSIPFYAHRQVLVPVGEEALKSVVSANQRAYIIGKVADLPLLATLADSRPIVKQGRFVLLHKQPPAAH